MKDAPEPGATDWSVSRRVASSFRSYRGELAIVVLLLVATSLLTLAAPFLTRRMFDVAIPRHEGRLVAELSAGLLGIVCVVTVLAVVQAYLSAAVGQKVMNDLRVRVYSHLHALPFGFFTRTQTGEVQSRLANDIGGLQVTLTSTVTLLVSNVTMVVATAAAMIALDWQLALLSFLVLPVFLVINHRVGTLRLSVSRSRQVQLAAMSVTVEESLSVSGIMLDRTMGRGDASVARFAAQSDVLAGLELRSMTAGQWLQALVRIIMAATPIVVFWLAGEQIAAGSKVASVGTIIAFVMLQQTLFAPASALLQLNVVLRSSLAMFERVFAYLDMPGGPAEGALPAPAGGWRGEVRIRHADFSYDGGEPTLRDVTLTVPAGSSAAVVGPTGAGKTTIGYLIARLYDASAGSVLIDDVDVRDLTFEALRGAVCLVSQETYLVHDTIAANLRFAKPAATDGELVAAARAAQIHDVIESLPDGYQTVVGERGYRLSGGEKQRLALARAMLRDTPVLVLDEATSALDPRTERLVQAAVGEFGLKRTVIAITHRVSSAGHADQILVVDGGRLVDSGSHQELLARDPYYIAAVTVQDSLVPATGQR
jgi:ATP-binding cassette subfamily B protein